MANAHYTSYLELLLQGGLNLSSLDMRFALVDLADYTFSAAHDFMNDVDVSSAVEAETGNLASKTFTGGTFDAADPTFTSVTGDQCEALVLFSSTGTRSTENVVLFLDTGITGIPVTPNGGNINVTLNASGIFSL